MRKSAGTWNKALRNPVPRALAIGALMTAVTKALGN